MSFVGQRNLPRARAGFYSQERYVEAVEYVLNRLHRQDSFEQHFTRRVEEVIKESERSHAENQVQSFQLNSEIEGIKRSCVHVYNTEVWCMNCSCISLP